MMLEKVVVLSAKNICGKYCPSKCQKEKERWLPIGFESIELNWNTVLAARTVVGCPTTHWIWNWVRCCQLPSGVWLSVSAFALLFVCLVHFLSLCVIVIFKESQISSLFRSLLLNFFGSQGWFPISKTYIQDYQNIVEHVFIYFHFVILSLSTTTSRAVVRALSVDMFVTYKVFHC